MKKITFLTSLLLWTLFISNGLNAQVTETFNGGSGSFIFGNPGTMTFNGFVFTAGTLSGFNASLHDSSLGYAQFTGNRLNEITIKKSGGGDFKLDELIFEVGNNLTVDDNITVTGYKNNIFVTGATNTFIVPGTFGTETTIDFTSITEFFDVDEIRIEIADDGSFGGLRIESITTDTAIPLLDTTPPVFENSTPSQSSVTQTNFTLGTDIDEEGTIYYVVVADGANAPTSAEVKAGTGSGGTGQVTSGNAIVNTGGFTNNFSVTGLTVGTAYDVYTVAEDDEGTPNLQASPTKIDVTTASPISLTITGLTGDDKAYDGTTTASASGTASLSGVVGADVVTLVGSPVYTFATSNVGTGITVTTTGYAISGADAGNYILTQPTLSADITQAPLTVTADSGLSKVYGSADPTFTYTITGFQGGDTEASLDTPVSISRVAGENVGVYLVTPSGALDANYSISFVTSTFGITQSALTVTADSGLSKVYGTSDPTFTYTITGFQGGDTEASLDTPVTISRAAGENVGAYVVTPSGASDANYSISFVTSTFGITQAALTVTGLTGDDKAFDGTTAATASGTATLSGVVGADDVTLGGTPVFTFATSNVGTGITISTTGYTISGTDAGNYTLTQPILSADITGTALTIDTISVTDVTCNGAADGSATVTVSGGAAPYSYEWSTGATTTANVLSGLAGGNYSVTVVDALNNSVMQGFTIAEGAPIEVTLTESPTVYFGYPPASNATIGVEGIIGGQAPYTYVWNTGETTQNIHVCPTATTTYSVTVTDANGCSTTADVIVNVVDVRCNNNGHGHHYGRKKFVKVCHKGKKTLCLPISAVAAHLNHGDTLGGCDSEPNGIRITNLKVYPNPFRRYLNVELKSTGNANVDLLIYNRRGRQVFQTTVSVTEGKTKKRLNLSRLKRGVYYLKVVVNGREVQRTRHLVKY